MSGVYRRLLIKILVTLFVPVMSMVGVVGVIKGASFINILGAIAGTCIVCVALIFFSVVFLGVCLRSP